MKRSGKGNVWKVGRVELRRGVDCRSNERCNVKRSSKGNVWKVGRGELRRGVDCRSNERCNVKRSMEGWESGVEER